MTVDGKRKRIDLGEKVKVNIQLVSPVIVSLQRIPNQQNKAARKFDSKENETEMVEHAIVPLLNEKSKQKNKIVCLDSDTNDPDRAGTVAVKDFRVNDLIWCQLKGNPSWPARITKIYGKHMQMLEITWFKDYRTSKIHKGQAAKFKPCTQTARAALQECCDSMRHGLEAAIKEAIQWASTQIN